MLNYKKLIPVAAVPLVALVLLVASMMSVGAQTQQPVHVPPGDIVVSPNANMASDAPLRPVPAAPALAPSTQPGTVTEAFDGTSLDAWQTVTDSPIRWASQDGRLQENLAIEDEPSEQQALFVSKASNFTNGSVEAEFYSTAGSPLGIVVRGSDQGYYNITLNMNVSTNTASKATIERVTPNGTQVIGTAPFTAYAGYNLQTWQHLLVSTQGNTITVYVDGKQIMSATDTASTALTHGWAGVWTIADQGASFDNLRIQPGAAR